MCGIVGLVAPSLTEDALRTAVGRMAETIHHRGPDGGGFSVRAPVAIGMKRLAIVDVQHGGQPMYSRDGDTALVYNGEIYNAPQLRRELEGRGVHFETRSDTEVILRLYEEEPDSVEEHLVGMWAFAIHDRRRDRLVLSRDRFGIKPLFVAARGRTVAFASEMRAFDRNFEALAPCFQLDHGAAHAMLAWSFVPEERTIFTGVERVAPATRLTVDLKTGTRTSKRYWQLVPSVEASRVRSLDEACETVDHLLARAVKEHLESDVPIATFLSGGIDSPIVASYALRAGASITAYTIGFRERRFDESPAAREAARRLGVELRVGTLDENTALRTLSRVLAAYDEPFGDSSSIATYLLCHYVSRDFKVALGGDGGDEVFAGYSKYQILPVRRLLGKVPGARRAVSRVLGALPTTADRTSRFSDLLRVANKTGRGLLEDEAASYVALTQVLPLVSAAPLLVKGGAASDFETLAMDRFRRAHGRPLQRAASADAANPLPNDMLTKVDRASMASSLEARVPFLDHRVVEYGVGLPEEFTLAGGGKRVLRTLHERRFGSELARRKKQGFGVPVERWLGGGLSKGCDFLFRRDRLNRFGLLSPETLSEGRHRALLRTTPMLLWHAFALAAWCEVTLGEGPSALDAALDGGG